MTPSLSTVLTAILAILVFGALILIHEFGHFVAAKKFGVRVNEFAIGMGPTVWSAQRGETLYALHLFPVGGFVSMEGEEDQESPDGRAFCNKKPWQRLLIMAAGPAMNLLLGYLLILGLTAAGNGIATPVIHSFDEDAVTSQYLESGDRILSMDGHRIHTANDISFYLSREADGVMDLVVLRDGEQVELPDVHFKMENVQGVDIVTIDFIVVGEPKTLLNVPVYALDWTVSLTKQLWFSIWDLVFSDRYGIEQMSGPVGVAGAIGESAAMGLDQFTIMVAVISLNLGVFNLLPLPALDGGRIFFVLLEMIRRKRLDPNIEGYINMAGLLALMALMVFVTFHDIVKLF